MKTFNFDHEPTYAELWEMCVENFLYNTKDYADDLIKLFENKGLGQKSSIADVSAGSGFPAHELSRRGFDIRCTDGFKDEVELFNKRAGQSKLSVRCEEVEWKDLLNIYQKNSFDFLLCRGNSFIYAGGGWNSMITINAEEALRSYTEIATIFFDLLKPGGFLYIDKFKDSETSHKEKVASIKVKDESPEDLIFWTERFPKDRIRKASMLRKKLTGEESGIPNIAYDLTFPEIENILTSIGFSKVESIKLPSETHFDILLAQK